MTTVNMKKLHLIGTGVAEMPQDGRRYRFLIERYRHDDGSEWGQIVSMEEIPDVGPYLWIPSYGVTEPAEGQYLYEEHQFEKTHPDPNDVEWWGEHREKQRQQRQTYDELRDQRAKEIKASPRTLHVGGNT